MRDDSAQPQENDSVEEFANAWADYYVGQGPRPESTGVLKPVSDAGESPAPARDAPREERPSEH